MSSLEKIVIEPQKTARSAVIWLHGLGADGHDFEPLVPQLHLPETRFIFPHAPIRPVTLNAAMPMRAWYDIYGLNLNSKEDEAGIRHSQIMINDLLNEQINSGLDPKSISLIGFSQGAALALHAGLRYEKTLGSIVALSAYLPLRHCLAGELQSCQMQTPIFMAHGSNDDILPMMLGEGSKLLLEGFQLPIKWRTYPMGHAVCPDEIDDLRHFLQQTIIKSIA